MNRTQKLSRQHPINYLDQKREGQGGSVIKIFWSIELNYPNPLIHWYIDWCYIHLRLSCCQWSLLKYLRCNWCWELVVINISDKNNRSVDGVEGDKMNRNENLTNGLNLKKEKWILLKFVTNNKKLHILPCSVKQSYSNLTWHENKSN